MKVTNKLCFIKRQSAIVIVVMYAALFAPLVHAQAKAEMIPFWNDREPDSKIKVDHSQWQLLLNRYVDDQHSSGISRFRYSSVTPQDRRNLSAYINFLQSYEPRQFNASEKMAYWINLYNAATVLLIIGESRIPVSIRDLRSGFLTPGPWRRKILTVSGQKLSLDDIEHGILRPIWKDSRIHYALNCASLGCPNIQKSAFTGENVDALLETAARQYINHPRGVRIEGGALILSSIYNWYADDFGSNFAELKNHLSEYVEPELAVRIQAFQSAQFSYDWNLNKP